MVIEKNRAKSQNFREKIWIIGNKCLSLHHEMAQPSEGRGEMLNRWNRLLASCTAGLERTFSKRCQSVVFKLRNFDSRNSGDAIEASSWVVFLCTHVRFPLLNTKRILFTGGIGVCANDRKGCSVYIYHSAWALFTLFIFF